MIKGVDNFTAMRIAATGLSAQRTRMDVIAENIANASTTRTASGGPYRRKEAIIAPAADEQPISFARALSAQVPLAATGPGHLTGVQPPAPAPREVGVRVAEIREDPREGSEIYDPTHPSADERGYVKLPNVELVTELVDLQGAARAYEANLAAMKAAEDAARETLQIGA